MGQYHKVYNIDRKEFIHPHPDQLWSKISGANGLSRQYSRCAVLARYQIVMAGGGGDVEDHDMVGRWAGDRIVVQGDYSGVNDKAHIPNDELEDYRDISSSVLEMLKITRM